jgi:aminoglycoside phosphotransferase (APT) family kinase protein
MKHDVHLAGPMALVERRVADPSPPEAAARATPHAAAATGATTPAEIRTILRRAGLIGLTDSPPMQPLTGGVSSDIWRVDTRTGPVCVKRALGRLKVAAEWRAPVERNAYEAGWMRIAARYVPTAVPRLLHVDEPARALVMTFLEPARHPVWKEVMRDGEVDAGFARAVGATLAAIHAGTAHDQAVAKAFASDRIFFDIRLEPYLIATGLKHPDIQPQLTALANRTAETRIALVHGDVSPKNILVGPDGPVLLDAECAWFGDPAFDLAFCLNHLLLKAILRPDRLDALVLAFEGLAEAYLAQATWEPRLGLEARAATLLPALFLARIDGKSPVEYVTLQGDKNRVRALARRFLLDPCEELEAIVVAWAEAMRG